MSTLRPKRCVLDKGANGYGFHLHGERGKIGQFIRLVEPDTPAETSGLRAGDRLVFVDGESVEGEGHQQVVGRIRATVGPLELIVVDADTAELLAKHGLQCRKEYVEDGIPLPAGADEEADTRSHGSTPGESTPRDSSPVPPRENGDASSERLSVSSSTKDEKDGLRPRLCRMKKAANGYGFNLHSDKAKPGQFIRAVDDDSPGQRAGLRVHDKIIQVNGVSVVGMQHSEVVAAIKAGGDETRLLVVDAETEEFFKRCDTLPTEEHINGTLPEPVSERRASEDEASAAVEPHEPASPTASTASSENSLPAAALSSHSAEVERAPEAPDKLGLSMSAAQAREKALKKRAGKKAPPMDWSKRNELFSNL